MPENPRLLNLGMNGILSKRSQVEPGEAEQIRTWSGYGQIPDWVPYETPFAVPPGVDTEISSASTARQSGLRLRKLLYEACRMNKWWISELSIEEDHVHIIIQTKPSDSVAEVVQRLKGGTSRVIRKEYPELEEFLWGDSFWADGYFAETVGNVDEDVVRRYIREQRR